MAGWALGINPFDQPNVQEAKDNTAKVLAAGDLPDVEAADRRAAGRRGAALLRGDHGYVQPRRVRRGDDRPARGDPRDRTKATTTFGYGPRFLHSTGQMHKGGPATGLFVQLVHDGEEDAEIPEAATASAT